MLWNSVTEANLLNNIIRKINLGIIPTVSAFLLPNEIFDFLRRNPKIEMNVKEMTTENVIKALKSGEIDGIISTPYALQMNSLATFYTTKNY
jgi:LysR family hydrogen peroxide-inducible transcriptional activator